MHDSKPTKTSLLLCFQGHLKCIREKLTMYHHHPSLTFYCGYHLLGLDWTRRLLFNLLSTQHTAHRPNNLIATSPSYFCLSCHYYHYKRAYTTLKDCSLFCKHSLLLIAYKYVQFMRRTRH